MARPSHFDQDIADSICELIAGGEPLAKICKMEGYPPIRTVYGWLDKFPEFEQSYARARKDQADTYADEIVALSDQTHRVLPNGLILPVDPARSKVQVDARKWVAAKLRPDRYGDQLNVVHSGTINVQSMDREACLAGLQELADRGVPIPAKMLEAPREEAPIDAEFEDVVPDEHPGADLC